MILSLPDHMHDRLVRHIASTAYCMLCEQHPDDGHTIDCPFHAGAVPEAVGSAVISEDATIRHLHTTETYAVSLDRDKAPAAVTATAPANVELSFLNHDTP